MKKSRYSDEQKNSRFCSRLGLKRQVREHCRKHGITDADVLSVAGPSNEGLVASDAKRLKALEDENRRLKKLVADLSLDNGREIAVAHGVDAVACTARRFFGGCKSGRYW